MVMVGPLAALAAWAAWAAWTACAEVPCINTTCEGEFELFLLGFRDFEFFLGLPMIINSSFLVDLLNTITTIVYISVIARTITATIILIIPVSILSWDANFIYLADYRVVAKVEFGIDLKYSIAPQIIRIPRIVPTIVPMRTPSIISNHSMVNNH